MRLAALLILLLTVSTRAADKPNFVIIMADDLGYGDITAGPFEGWIETPSLKKMAAEGMCLTDFHSNGAVCSPTRAALLTGRYQQRAGIPGVVYANPQRPEHRHGLQEVEVTFAELLKENDYKTAIFGKWHLGYEKQYNPITQGFDEFRGFVSGNVDYQSHIDQAANFDWWINDEKKDEEGYTTHLITRHALRFIKENKDQPFCLYLPHEAPHYPMQGPNDPAERTINGTFQNQGSVQDKKRAYTEMVQEMDKGIGNILDLLRELKIHKNTLVIFCSDNGATHLGSNGQFRGRKGTLWEGGHRVPAICWWPGTIEAGSMNDSLCIGMDWMPTMLAAANIPMPRQRPLDGVSLLPILQGNGELPERILYWQHGNNRALRSQHWKLIQNTGKVMLFDLQNDPAESNDLASDRPQAVNQFRNLLDQWQTDVADGATAQP